MPFKFRKSFKILPGIKINLSKSGVSTSISGKGHSVNIGKKGIKTSVGIPGTGISYSATSKIPTQPRSQIAPKPLTSTTLPPSTTGNMVQSQPPKAKKFDLSNAIAYMLGGVLIIAALCSVGGAICGGVNKALGILPTSTPKPVALSTATHPARVMIINTPTELAQAFTATPSFTDTPKPLSTAAAAIAAACPPAKPSQTGTVLDVIDGVTLRVMIEGATYTVKYIGLQAPAPGQYYSAEAKQKNAKLTFAKKVALIPGAMNKDPNGALLRYVLLDGLFINTELLKQGYISVDPNFAEPECLSIYHADQQTAQNANTGLWGAPPTAVIPPTQKAAVVSNPTSSSGVAAPTSQYPSGATAICNDGTYSFSQTHSGTCSHHGGVRQWLK